MSEIRGEYVAVREGAECLYPSEVVQVAVEQMAHSIRADYEDLDPLVLCVMVGGLRITSDLLAHLDFPLELDYLQVSRYRDQTRGGTLDWRRYPGMDLRGREVVIVDDILDEGVTLAAIRQHCEDVGAASVATAVLVDKQVPQRTLEADYRALSAPNRYLFGEGMDYKGYGRNLRGIWAVAGA
ncbi:MAG TPA: hypoxanthine-guanine phosphoribosyltransferase [Pseudomonadales bacterium]|nr:hypoxanthine-guanine phosphoribosyltransferase [Pseudomonadales bacterium]